MLGVIWGSCRLGQCQINMSVTAAQSGLPVGRLFLLELVEQLARIKWSNLKINGILCNISCKCRSNWHKLGPPANTSMPPPTTLHRNTSVSTFPSCLVSCRQNHHSRSIGHRSSFQDKPTPGTRIFFRVPVFLDIEKTVNATYTL